MVPRVTDVERLKKQARKLAAGRVLSGDGADVCLELARMDGCQARIAAGYGSSSKTPQPIARDRLMPKASTAPQASKTIAAGLDIGSRTIALVEWDGEQIARAKVVDTGTDPVGNARELVEGRIYDRLVATGYGRHLAVERELANEVISEIKAYGLGAYHLYRDVGTVLDIGGQDSKVIRVGPGGRVLRFEMNDRCAAGTGRFLENMAHALGMQVDEFGPHALEAGGRPVRISSMCTVFAESEVVSLIARGKDSHRVALGLHQSIVDRVGGMIRRVGVEERFVFAGGVANNPCLQQLFAASLGVSLAVPDEPQIVGALGAALHAASTRADVSSIVGRPSALDPSEDYR